VKEKTKRAGRREGGKTEAVKGREEKRGEQKRRIVQDKIKGGEAAARKEKKRWRGGKSGKGEKEGQVGFLVKVLKQRGREMKSTMGRRVRGRGLYRGGRFWGGGEGEGGTTGTGGGGERSKETRRRKGGGGVSPEVGREPKREGGGVRGGEKETEISTKERKKRKEVQEGRCGDWGRDGCEEEGCGGGV